MIENQMLKPANKRDGSMRYKFTAPMVNPCECGMKEAVAMYKGKQMLCESCLAGICEVTIL